jgi:solute carrier family 25 iron transporter 28/37
MSISDENKVSLSTTKSSESIAADDDDDLEWEEWNPSKISFVNHMIAGSIAGLAEHISIFPLDTVKTYIQCEKCGYWSISKTYNCVARMVNTEGPFRLWRGVSAMFAGCIPGQLVPS